MTRPRGVKRDRSAKLGMGADRTPATSGWPAHSALAPVLVRTAIESRYATFDGVLGLRPLPRVVIVFSRLRLILRVFAPRRRSRLLLLRRKVDLKAVVRL